MQTATVSTYKKLLRVIARIFYAGEIPPPGSEVDAPQEKVGRRKSVKVDTTKAGVLVLDAMTRHEWVKEEDLSQQLNMHHKLLRRVMQYFEQEGVIVREHRKEPRKNSKQPDAVKVATAAAAPIRSAESDEELEKNKTLTLTYASINYAKLVDNVNYRLWKMKKALKEEVDSTDVVQIYVCPGPLCRSEFSAFDAAALLDRETMTFRCENCQLELEQASKDGQAGDEQARRKRVEISRAILARIDRQLKPLTDILESLKDVRPPDYGSLNEWAADKYVRIQQQQQRAAGGNRQGGGGQGGRRGMNGQEEEADWGDTKVEVHLDGVLAGPSTSAPAAPTAARPMPWFLGSGTGMVTAASAASVDDKGQAKPDSATQQAYYEAYMKQMYTAVQSKAAAGMPQTPAAVKPEPQEPHAKRIKLEQAEPLQQPSPSPLLPAPSPPFGAPSPQLVAPSPTMAAVGELQWEDAAEAPSEAPQAEALVWEEADGGDFQWENAD